MATLFRDLDFLEGSGDLLTDNVAGAVLVPEQSGHSFQWGYGDVNGTDRPYLTLSAAFRVSSTPRWLGVPYGANFFDGSNNLAWTVAIMGRYIMISSGGIFNSQTLKLLTRLERIQWGNGLVDMVLEAEVKQGEWAPLIFSSPDGRYVNIYYNEVTDASLLRTLDLGAGGARLSGNWLRIGAENNEGNPSTMQLARMSFYIGEMSEAERLAFVADNGGKAGDQDFFILTNQGDSNDGLYIWEEVDAGPSESELSFVEYAGNNSYKWDYGGGTCQGGNACYIKRGMDTIWLENKVVLPTNIDPETGATYTAKMPIFWLFEDTVSLTEDIFMLFLDVNLTTNVFSLGSILYRNSGGQQTIAISPTITITKGVEHTFKAKITYSTGAIDIWLDGTSVYSNNGLTLNRLPFIAFFNNWQGTHLTPPGGFFYSRECYVGEIERVIPAPPTPTPTPTPSPTPTPEPVVYDSPVFFKAACIVGSRGEELEW